MLKNKKKVRKIRNIIVALIAIIMILGVFIKMIQSETIEIKTIGINSIEHMRASTTIDMEYGTINPIYRPKWEKISSSFDAGSKTVTVKVKGAAYRETQNIDSNVNINYASDVTSTLSAEDITVFVDGVKVTNSTHPIITVDPDSATQPEISTNETTGKTEITHTIVISNLEETVRQSGIPFKEWSGNIKIKIAGRGQNESTYSKDVLTDVYGNQSMMEIDETGTWIDVTFGDDEVDKNTSGTMFADFIKPEFTYKYANTTIDHDTKKVTVVFDVTDKYFSSSKFTADDITIAMIDDGTSNVNVDVTKTLTLKTIATDVTDETTGITYKTDGSIYYNGKMVGQRYELVLEGLEQLDENGLPNGYTYSGPMSIVLPSGTLNEDGTLKVGIIDNSGNLNLPKTITVGIDETDGNMDTDEDGSQQVVDVVDPIWEVGQPTTDEDAKTAIIKLTAKDKYFKESTLTTDKIKIYVNGVESTEVVKNLSAPTAISDGVEYTLTLSNLEPTTGGLEDYTEFTPIDAIVGGTAKYRNENGGSMKIEIAEGTIEDQYQNFSNTQEFNIGIIDATMPEVYVVQKTKDTSAKNETIIFNVTDKNYDSEDLVEKGEITVFVDGDQVDDINKSSLTSVAIKTTINGETKIVGHQYTLVLDGFESATKNANGYNDWSGTVSIQIAQNASKDTKGNTLKPDTTTISDFVDFLKPQIEQVTVAEPIDATNKTYTFKFTAIDKYMNISDLITESEIKVYVDGVEATTVDKDLTSTAITKTFKKTVDGTVTEGNYTIGHEYTLVLSGFEETDAEFAESGRNYIEWSGNVSIEVLAEAVKDQGPNGDNVNPNTNDLKQMNGHFVDFIKPRIEEVSSTRDASAKTETIIFNVMDKYLNTADALADTEITVYVDKEQATGVTKTLTKVQDFKATVNGDSTHVVGRQYQLVLSNFEQTRTSIDRNREYSDWSGTVSIDIVAGAIKDNGPKGDGTIPNTNDPTTIDGDFVDFISPNVTYEYVTGDIDYNGKTFTMVFDITDKYFANSTLATQYTNATTDAEKLAVLQNYLTIKVDGEDITADSGVTKKIISIEDVKAANTINKTVDGTVQTGLTNQVIGKRYTLEISNLQQDTVDVGDEYLDYSGVITVAIKDGTATDNGPSGNGTNTNGNIATTITSGVNVPGGSGTGTIVDVVDPIWEVAGTAVAKTANQTASIPIKGTDKYLNTIGLTASDITVEVNGEVKTSADGIIVTVIEDTSATLAYGKQYIVKVDGYASDAYQVKVTLREGLIVDESGNTSKETSFILFSCLKETSTETEATSGFLGNTNIQRQKIEKIIFQDNLDGMNSTKWDVSQMQDSSILGWYTTDATTGNYTVYIGSYIIMNGNVNSSYLFANIAKDSTCKVTGNTGATDDTEKPLIENIELLHVDGVANMSHMFEGFGYSTMKSLDLGSDFDTISATDMSYMFRNCGYTAMTSLDLGEKFDTINVTDMNHMFQATGFTAMNTFDIGNDFNTSSVLYMQYMFASWGNTLMESLNLGTKFNTSSVTNMSYMFYGTGTKAMKSITLGDAFDTSSVTNMEAMFFNCGYYSMESLNLGDNFNTSAVENMKFMFLGCGYAKMTSLDLGNLFYTTSVTDMSNMFNGCGQTLMTTLDLGPAFTKIANTYSGFMTNCGNSSTVIYASESIFNDMKNFKLNTTSTTTINYANGTINPIYKPEFTKVSSSLDTTTDPTNPTMTIVVKGDANKSQIVNGVNIDYSSDVTNTLIANDITVYINGVVAESIEKPATTEEQTNNKDKIFKEIVSATTVTNETTGKQEIEYTIKLSNFDQGTRQTDTDGNMMKYDEWSGNVSLQFAKGKLKDMYGSQFDVDGNFENISGNGNLAEYVDETGATQKILVEEDTQYNKNTDGKMFVDVIKPEFTYEYSETTIDYTGKTLTVVFYVADKYFDSANSSLALTDLDFEVDGTTVDINVTGNSLTSEALADGTGTKYTLVVANLQQDPNDGINYSGPVSITIPADKIADLSGNKNISKTLTIGQDDPENDANHNTDVVVDVVDPIWTAENINIDSTNKQVTVDLIGKDKYMDTTKTLTKDQLKDKIKVTIDDVEITRATNVIKTVSDPVTSTNETTGATEVKYTLTLSNWEEAERQDGKDYKEFSGTTEIEIEAGTLTDQSGNTNLATPFTLGHVDFINPEIVKISSTKDALAKTETIVFTVTDKYLDTTDLLTMNDITVLVDGVATTELTTDLTHTDITDSTRGNIVVGHTYTLVLSDFEKVRNAKNYKDWSGTVSIEIAEGAVQDQAITSGTNTSGGNGNDATTIKGDFVDFINPDLKYVHQSTDINKSSKTYTMTFSVTDKYYTSGKLSIDDLTIKMENGQLDSDGNAIVYNLKNQPVTITLQDAELYAQDVAITNTTGTVETVSELLIGHTYILKIENLEKLEVKEGFTTADYSGVITVAVEGNKVLDRTVDGTQNGNVATTITSGVNIPGGTSPDDAEVVDVVDPIWKKVSSSASAIDPDNKTSSTATITFNGTDSYFANSTLTKDNIKVLVDGTEVTSGITKNLSAATSLEEQRKEFGSDTTATKQYGVQYTLTITGFAQDANQVKIQLPAGTITDESGNGNKTTDLIVYNVLRNTTSETVADSAFLGNISVQRKNVENVTFVSSLSGINTSVAWDVSAQQDGSIMAWYADGDTAPYKVYIGSDNEIFANRNSSYLFSYIGYADTCTAEEAITNIDSLNVTGVTDMSYIFQYCGYRAMTNLNLGNKFDTSNVTNMSEMFSSCGYTEMTSVSLGNKFDTSNVTDMSGMFSSCGYTAMTSLDLGTKFDTSNVTNMSGMFSSCGYTAMTSLNLENNFDTSSVADMSGMFQGCGYTEMTSLDLGDKFDTSSVTDMSGMFSSCGYTEMTSLDLGTKFDTSNVTNMSNMFQDCGYTAMTSLDLGDLFYTTSTTDMLEMFQGCGYTAMTSLDLGPAFTRIADTNTDFITNCGASGAIIYAPESIYNDMKHLKLNSTSTTTIEYTEKDADGNATGTRGTINPIYKPEWTKVSSALKPNATTPTALEVTVKGNAIQSQTVGGVNINYNSNVTSTLEPEDITVYINGVQDGDRNGNGVIDEGEAPVIQVAVSAGTPTSTDTTEVTHTITLTNFEEATRQLDADGNIKKFSEWSGNISIKIAGREEGTDTYTANVLTDVYGNQSMSAKDDTSGDWIDVIYKDADTDHNTDGTMFTDFIKPEFTYEYSETTIDYTGKTLTAIFYAADKYFDNANSSLALADLTIKVDGDQIVSDDGTNTFTAEAYNDAGGNRIGTKYTLVIKNLPRTTGDPYNDYSGPVTIAIPEDKISDLSGNKNIAKTITIGQDDPTTGDGHNTEAIVDVVDPIWKVVGDIEKTIDASTGEISVSMDIYGTDKYYKEDTLTADQIQLWVDGVEITAEGSSIEVTRTLTKVEDLTEIRDEETVTYGVHYKLTIGQIKESDTAFFAERTKYNADSSTGRPYREYSGTMKLVIPANTITDNYDNKNLKYEIPLDHVDTLRPEVIQVSSESNIDTTNVENSTQTIVFDVVDKYLARSAISTTDTSKIHVLIDGEEAESITKPSTAEEQANNSDKIFKEIVNIETLTDTVGGDANHLVGYRYTLKLSNFENPRTSAVYGDYTTWSGNLSIKVDANTATDTNGTGNAETELTGDEQDTTKEYVDFVKPDVTYKYSGTSKDSVENPEIDYDGKTYTMVFEITDKNFANSTLTIDDLDILIDGEEPNWRTASDSADTVGVIKDLTVEDVTGNVNGSNKVIGKRYTLTLSHLEQLQKLVGKETVDYSGVITVAIPANVVTDKGPKGTSTQASGNDATTITSGIDIPGGDISGDGTVVDVVDPIWEKVSSSASAIDPTDKTTSTATIIVKGTDKYYASSSLTADKIKVFVNGTEVTDGSVTVSVDSTVTDVNSSGGTKIGDQYTITIKGFAQDANQMKIQIQPGAMTDQSGNTNKATDLIVYNVLRSAATETAETSAFLGNSTIQRQNIENVTFETNIPETVYNAILDEYVDSTAWDVSAMQDKSIIAWYETNNENGALKVYIGSNDEIFANKDSSYLFSYIGYADICTATEAITNIDSLNVTGVTNMSYMFQYCGYIAMTSLDLETKFDTSNVTNMSEMFSSCGYTEMTSVSLGTKFDTSNVTDMSGMFSSCGYTAMTSLNLENNFDTSSVTDMSGMFSSCGYTAMTSLNLGNNFDTSSVTDMSGMFSSCGYTEMTSLDLGDNFDTSSVTDMSGMFQGCGYTVMTSLDLGTKFDTSNVTNMSNMFQDCGYTEMTSLDLGDLFYTTSTTDMLGMFQGCGYTAMTSLDLGPAFTRIADINTDFITNCGESGAVIYAPESIYNDMKHLKLNSTSTTTIEYTEKDADGNATGTRGTINPIYKTEWTKVSSTINEANKTISIYIKGTASLEPQIINGVTINYNSNVTSTLAGNLINVYIDGELDGDTNKNGILDEDEATSITRTVVKDETNSTATDIYYTITLSNLEETLRQSGKNFKEWSGNISIQPLNGTLKDAYGSHTTTDEDENTVVVKGEPGNGNMQEIDLTEGTWTKVELQDTATDHNTDGTMFTDYINPEFTYEYSNVDTDTDANTVIDYESKTVTVVFDVTDKYFDQANITADNMTIEVDGTEPNWAKVTKTLTKKTLGADKTVGDITYKANGDIYYTVNGTSTKIGERYELVVSNLETENGVGYSGAMTMSFPAGELNADSTLKCGIIDKSGNLSLAKTITIGIDDPENHEEHKDEVIVDVVNPLWTGPHNVNSIDRTNNTVDIKILGSDKYYASNSLTTANIKVYVDDVEQTGITKNLTQISSTDLQTLIASADLQNANAEDVAVGYTLTLGNFAELSGETKIVIDAGTITDQSGNVNLQTTIPVGNIIWEEANEPLESTDANYPRYDAFRNDIVDFIDPVIKYQYSAVNGAENPDIDYEAKTLTVKFTVTDKYLVESSIMNADGTLNTDNVRIQISTLNASGVEEFKDITDDGLTTTITSQAITDGYEYTLVVEDFEQVYNNKGQYMDYSGIVQLVFAEGQIDDRSGNKNIATTITIDTDNGDDPNSGVIVDVIDPVIEKTADNLSIINANNGINRDIENETGTVSVRIKATDKYLSNGTLQSAENVDKIKVKVVKPSGETVYPDTITKSVSQISKQATSIIYQITLGNFETNEGVTSIIIPEGVITDTSGNGNQETEVLVGNSTWTETGDSAGEYTAFKNSIVDFTRPTWEYATSSITRDRDGETGTVTVKILGRDIYYLKDTLTESKIFVYVANSETPDTPVTTITKSLSKITDSADLEGADTGYYLTLGNFGTYDGQVKIEIADNTIKDTSGNGNKITEMLVGNPNWVETDIGDSTTSPKYTAFRDSIVDFIKPTIKYQYTADVNPLIDQGNKQVSIIFDAVDTNFLESVITVDDIQILVDDMDVTGTLTKNLTHTDITDGSGNGIRYTLTLSSFELTDILEGETFKRHSGKIELIIAPSTVRDTSGNENIETRIIVDNDNGDDAENYVIVDFINPKIYYVDKFISWDKRYATVTVAGTDRFYDFDTTLSPSDITLYQLNLDGQYVQVTDLPITVTPVQTEYGYNFVIRLDDFEEEYKMKISIPAGKILDTEGHSNEATDIIVNLDNKKPTWKYISTDTSQFESDGQISFNVKGQDKFLNLTNSGLADGDVSVYRDGTDITDTIGVTINYLGQDESEKSKSYKIDVTGLTEIGTYSLVFKEATLIDEFDNESATTTITFSKSVIASNTDNYQTVTYHASPDFEQTHQAYVHELMSVNATGTNFENTTFRPSTIGEIYDDGKNTLFAEPFKYEAGQDGAAGTQTAYSFKGWAVANEKGFIEDEENSTIYGLYDEIPDTAKATDGIVHLKAVWQEATVVFVSDGDGNNSNDGLSPTTPVKDLETAYSKISGSGTVSTNIIVIMDAIEWNSSNKLTGNATITSLYAGVDYKAQGAELKISSNMEVDGDIKFDNIELYSNSTSVSNGSDYLANGSYTNMLITNYGDVTLGRRISTPDGKYTFGAVVGGNYGNESTIGEIGVHTVIVEAGRYNNIVIGSALGTGGQTSKTKYVSHQVLIGNMKDAAISRNDNLTITGYVSMGELEDKYYPYDKSGSDTVNAYSRYYAITHIYSGTFTGENKFAKASENASIYLRPMNGFADGKVELDMYGGDITGNLYAGARMATSNSDQVTNILNFYGGDITGNIFGHGGNDTSTGGSEITLEGIFGITGNIFGGSNATTEAQGKVTGNTSILVNSSSITVDGNIYGGSNGVISGTSINLNTGLITGDTNIELSAGTVTGDIYGGGYNCGNTGSANITINNGVVSGSIYGGAYQNQVRTDANITVLGGTVNAIYGGNVLTIPAQQNSDSTRQNANIIIGDTASETTPTVNGPIYGSGKYDKVGTTTINLVKCATTPAVYGGSDGVGLTDIANIYLQGMTVDAIYGGPNGNGTVTTSNIYLEYGTATDVYGGGYDGTTTTSNINLEGTATVTSIYGGSNTTGTVTTSNVTLKSGTVTNVFGGGNSASVGTANVTLDGITIDTIHGGSKNAGNTTNTNVVLTSGTVTNVFGGGYDVGATNAKVTQQGATVTTIYGGNEGGTGDGGETTNSTVNIENSVANNIYGGNMGRGTTKYTTINISGTSTINGKLYGGGYRSAIGKSGDTGSTTINISGGTINRDIYGGSEDSVVYGETNINIGKDAVTDDSLTAGNINIRGIIYGAGSSSTSTDYSSTSVYGNTHITMDNSSASSISFAGSIYGAGKGTNYSTNNTTSDDSTVKIKDFGTATNAYQMVSIQRTGKLYIGNSYLELSGTQDVNNYYKNTSYTLNRITNGLALHDNTTLYTKRGFNMVGGFESFKTNGDGSTTKESVSISGTTVTRNVDNRLYTLEGINLIFAKQEGELSDRSNEDIWGDVNGMAFFGMYRINRTTFAKEYDIYAPNYTGGAVENFFANGTYVEGRHKANHDTTVDGFYTNVGDYSDLDNITVVPQVIDVTDYGTYYDWIIGADIVNYDVGPLIASTYSTWSTAELTLDYKYEQGAMYTVNRVSVNALGTDVNLINPLEVPTYSANANNTFGLTMETDTTGWLQSGTTNMYTDGNGTFDGATAYKTDNSDDPGTIIFKIFNSVNVTENKDLGNVNIVLTGKTRTGEDVSEGNIFRVVIALSLQSVYEEDKEQYTPRFTDSTETELNYTTDSSVDITYLLYKQGLTESIYTSGDYRVLSSTVQLPAGTRITMRDYGQGDDVNKVYYYQIASDTDYDATETVDGKTRYLYRLDKFIDMGGAVVDTGIVAKYADDNSSYYHSSYALEKYDISIDLIDSGIDTNQLAQETYLELRNLSGTLKYDNGDKDLTYNLYNNNATMTQSISNEGNSYSVYENLTIPFTFDATLLEQTVDGSADGANIMDTKYYDKKIGLAIEIVDETGERVKAPEVQNLKLTNTKDSTQVYTAGNDGVIRVPISDGLATIQNNYDLSLSQYQVPAGTYKAKVYFFASDDGLHYGNETTVMKEFNITFINRLLGLAGVESTNNSRIINKTTGLNLEGNSGLDLTVKVGSPTDDTNIRVELYKRNSTYTVTEDEDGNTVETYNGIQYTQVDLAQYLDGTWETPEDQGLVTTDGCIEYMVMPKETFDTVVDLKTVEFEKAIKEGISTGEYKLVFKAYFDNTVIQTVRKTFIVTP